MPARYIDPFDSGSEQLCSKPDQRLTYEQVKNVIDREDPLGLLRGLGCPADEYDPEIKDIVYRRNKNNALLNPAEIRVIFEYWFFPGCIDERSAETISKELQALFLSDDT